MNEQPPKTRRGIRSLRVGVGIALGLAGLAFLLRTILRDRASLASAAHSPEPLRLTASTVLLLFTFWLGVVVWREVIALMGMQKPGLRRLLSIWFVSGIARYLPGKVWRLLSVAALAEHAQIDTRALLASMLVHAGVSLAGALFTAAATLPFVFERSTLTLAAVPAGIVASLGFVHPWTIGTALRIASPLLRGTQARWVGTWVQGIRTMLLAVLLWSIYGVAFHLLASSMTPLGWEHLPAVIGMGAVGFLAGQAAIIVPAGLGVRELALAGMMQPLVGTAVAALIAVTTRLWIASAELFGLVIAVVADRLAPPPPVAAAPDPD